MSEENKVAEEAIEEVVEAPAEESAADDSAEKQLMGKIKDVVASTVKEQMAAKATMPKGEVLVPAQNNKSVVSKQATKYMSENHAKAFNELGSNEQRKEFEELVVIQTYLKALKWNDYATLKDLSEGTDSEGGFLVPSPLAARIFDIVTAKGDARREMTVLPMTAETLDLSTLATKPTVSIVAEAAQIPAGDAAFGRKTLTAEKIAGINAMSSEILEDANIDLIPFLTQKFAEAFMEFEDGAFFNTSAAAGITGILQDAGVNNVVMSTGNTSFSNLDLDNLIDAVYALDARQRQGAKWVMSSDIVAIVSKLNDSQDRPLWTLVREGEPQRLLGYAVIENDEMPVTADDAVSTSFIAFGNFKNYMIGDRRAIKADVLTEGTVGSTNLAEKDSVALRVTERISGIAPTPLSFSKITTAAS